MLESVVAKKILETSAHGPLWERSVWATQPSLVAVVNLAEMAASISMSSFPEAITREGESFGENPVGPILSHLDTPSE